MIKRPLARTRWAGRRIRPSDPKPTSQRTGRSGETAAAGPARRVERLHVQSGGVGDLSPGAACAASVVDSAIELRASKTDDPPTFSRRPST